MVEWIPANYQLTQQINNEELKLKSLSVPTIKWKDSTIGGFNPLEWFENIHTKPVASLATAPAWLNPQNQQSILNQLQSSSNPFWAANIWNPQGILGQQGAVRQGYENWEAPTWHTGVNMPEQLGGEEIAPSAKTAAEIGADMPLWLAGGAGASAAMKAIKGTSTAAKVGKAALKYGLGGTETKPATQAVEAIAKKPLITATEISPKEQPAIITKFLKSVDEVQSARAELTGVRKADFATRVKAAEEARDFTLQQTNDIDAAMKAYGHQLKGQYEKGVSQLGEQFTDADIKELKNLLFYKGQGVGISSTKLFDLNKAMESWFMNAELPRDFELNLMERALGKDFVQGMVKTYNALGKEKFQKWLDAANLPRAVLASMDVSAPARQGAVLFARHPVEGFKSMSPMFKALVKEKYATMYDDIIRNRPNFIKGQESGLYHAPITAEGALAGREEAFMSRILSHTGKSPVRASERAYITYLNDIRSRVWEQSAETFKKLGATDLDYTEMAKLINFATGRGSKLPGISAPLANAIFFSPRLIMSRLQLPTMLASKSPLVRKEAWKTMFSFLGMGTGMLSLLSLAGGKVGLDPRSSEFGKVRFGNTRLDFWAGYVQIARFLTRLATGTGISTTGKKYDVNRRDEIIRFIQSKLAPSTGFLYDLLAGQTYAGEEVIPSDPEGIKKQVISRTAPLWLQDMADAITEEGAIGGLYGLPGAFGVGVITYNNESKSKSLIPEIKWKDESDNSSLVPKIKWKQ